MLIYFSIDNREQIKNYNDQRRSVTCFNLIYEARAKSNYSTTKGNQRQQISNVDNKDMNKKNLSTIKSQKSGYNFKAKKRTIKVFRKKVYL